MVHGPPAPPRGSHVPDAAPGAGSGGRRLARLLRSGLELVRLLVTLGFLGRLRARRAARLLRRSELFDARHYLAQCGDDPEARKDPIAHYLSTGAARGLEPTPLFDRARWIASHPAAGARGRDAFLHFARSRRGVAEGTPPASPGRPAPDPGEALLARHPFRAPPPEDGAHRALVVGAHAAGADPARVAALAEALRGAGWAVTIAPGGQAELLAHVVSGGSAYHAALVAGPEAAFEALPALRAYAPQAVVAHDPAWLRAAWRAGAERGASGGPDDRLERLERVNAICSNVVLAATRAEQEALLARLGGVDAELVEDAELRPGAAKADLGARLLARAPGRAAASGGGPG